MHYRRLIADASVHWLLYGKSHIQREARGALAYVLAIPAEEQGFVVTIVTDCSKEEIEIYRELGCFFHALEDQPYHGIAWCGVSCEAISEVLRRSPQEIPPREKFAELVTYNKEKISAACEVFLDYALQHETLSAPLRALFEGRMPDDS